MLADRVLHTTTTTGTGTYDLTDPASALYLSAVASVGSGNRLTYAVEFGTAWEICWGVVTAGSPATLTRNLIRSSTGSLINWGAGTKTLYSISQNDLVRFGARGAVPTASGTNTITVTHATPLRTLLNGMAVQFLPAATNTGAATLNVDGTGAIALVAPDGVACVGGEVRAGYLTTAVYDGTSWRLAGLQPSPLPLITTASGASNVDFALPSIFAQFRLVCTAMSSTSNAAMLLRVSFDGGATYDSGASAYTYATTLSNSGTSAGGGATTTSIDLTTTLLGNDGRGTADILIEPGATGTPPTFTWRGGGFTNTSVANMVTGYGWRNLTGRITNVRILPGAGTLSGTFALHRVK